MKNKALYACPHDGAIGAFLFTDHSEKYDQQGNNKLSHTHNKYKV